MFKSNLQRGMAALAAAALVGPAVMPAHAILNDGSIRMNFQSRYTSANGAEIVGFDAASKRLFVVAGTVLEVLDLSNVNSPTLINTINNFGSIPAGQSAFANSVTIKNGIVAVAVDIRDTATNAQKVGRVAFYDTNGVSLNTVNVGFLPDMVTFTPDGSKVLVANEGEPNSYGQASSFDPEGSVSIIDISSGVASATVTHATFNSFDAQIATLKASGIRIFGPGATVSQDLEPEYITISADGTKAYVTIQEANALATVDIATSTVTSIKSFGLKDHSLVGNGLDTSDRDVPGASNNGIINIAARPVFGMYMPDAIASVTVGGQTYLVTANEGDARDYTGFTEEVRVGAPAYVLDPTLFPNSVALKDNDVLGRLTVTNQSGNIDGDGDFDRIQAFGARSFSIWDSAGNLVWDSGNQLEQITATLLPALFNSDGTVASFDTRSDNKGPEPESVTVAEFNGKLLAFVGLERTGGVLIYDISNPLAPVFVNYANTAPVDLGPEGLIFVSAADSPSGKALLISANEVSRTVAIFEIVAIPEPATGLLAFSGVAALALRRRRV